MEITSVALVCILRRKRRGKGRGGGGGGGEGEGGGGGGRGGEGGETYSALQTGKKAGMATNKEQKKYR